MHDVALRDDHDDRCVDLRLGDRLGQLHVLRLGSTSTCFGRVHEQEEHEHGQHVDHRHEVDPCLALVPLVMPRHPRGATHVSHRSSPSSAPARRRSRSRGTDSIAARGPRRHRLARRRAPCPSPRPARRTGCPARAAASRRSSRELLLDFVQVLGELREVVALVGLLDLAQQADVRSPTSMPILRTVTSSWNCGGCSVGVDCSGRQVQLEHREPNEAAVHEQEEHEDRHHVDHRREVDLGRSRAACGAAPCARYVL